MEPIERSLYIGMILRALGLITLLAGATYLLYIGLDALADVVRP